MNYRKESVEVRMKSKMNLRDVSKSIAKKYNTPLEVDKFFIYKGKPIKITKKEKRRRPYTIFLWYWRIVKADGSLTNYTCSKYDDINDVHHFKPITESGAIKLAKEKENE